MKVQNYWFILIFFIIIITLSTYSDLKLYVVLAIFFLMTMF